MEERIRILEDKITSLEYALEFQQQLNESFNNSIEATDELAKSSTIIAKGTLDKFELINAKLKNKDLEIQALNSMFNICEMNIEMIQLRLKKLGP